MNLLKTHSCQFLLLGATSVATILIAACGSPGERDDRDLFVPSSNSEDAFNLAVSDLVCQVDSPTLTASALGAIENNARTDQMFLLPVVDWLSADGELISSHRGRQIELLERGETALFNIPAPFQDEMARCRISISTTDSVPVIGHLEADAESTSELAK